MECMITSQSGFGGAILCTGETNTTNFVECVITETYAPGVLMSGYPINVISLIGGDGMNVSFNSCDIRDCTSGVQGVVYQEGGRGTWDNCEIKDNNAYVSFGTYTAVGATPQFFETVFKKNSSRYGTVYFDSTGLTRDRMMVFGDCTFRKNDTEDGTYGGVLYAIDDVANGSPLVHFTNCNVTNNNSHAVLSSYDIETPYFPEMRIGVDFRSVPPSEGPATIAGDLNGDGIVNGADMGILLGSWGLGG